MCRRTLPALVLAVGAALALYAQRPFSGTPEILNAFARLETVSSALMIAAHPDDENTALLAWLARGRHVRTGYLSLTRGEGGQNLIGSEQGFLLGVIRTQELQQARKVDGAEQFFTSAVDFGYSKTAEETLRIWDRQKILGEIVYLIRSFRPDVVILRFSGTPRDGHGHHQASAMLGREAFAAAADPSRFPEQLKEVQPWRARRVVWNAFAFTPEQEREAARMGNRVSVDVGAYDPAYGYSYAEIAGISRSLHRSQAFGAPQRKGGALEYLVHVAGEPAVRDVLDGVQTRWADARIASLAARLRSSFDPSEPAKSVPLLLEFRRALRGLADPVLRTRKLQETDEAIALAAGLWLDAAAASKSGVAGSSTVVRVTALNRSPVPMTLLEPGGPAVPLARNQPVRREITVPLGTQIPTTPAPVLFRLSVAGEEIIFERPVVYRHVDRMYGERTQPFAVVPPVSLSFADDAILFSDAKPRRIAVEVTSQSGAHAGTLALEAPGWTVEPKEQPFAAPAGRPVPLYFYVTPPASRQSVPLRARTDTGKGWNVRVVDHPHMESQTVITPATAQAVRADVVTLARNVGYIAGAGDEVPRALEQMGCTVTLLSDDDLLHGDLNRFDALVTGVRAYNVREALAAAHARLMRYVEQGGTLVVQYNVVERGRGSLSPGPYPIAFGRSRISVEDAPVTLVDPASPLLRAPNRITSADFADWVQERGLYFPESWDPKYKTVVSSHDPGEPPLHGGILYTRHGRGAFVFTSFSWFRQLPAGVSGAYRIFANLLSAGRTLEP